MFARACMGITTGRCSKACSGWGAACWGALRILQLGLTQEAGKPSCTAASMLIQYKAAHPLENCPLSSLENFLAFCRAEFPSEGAMMTEGAPEAAACPQHFPLEQHPADCSGGAGKLQADTHKAWAMCQVGLQSIEYRSGSQKMCFIYC